MRLALTSLWIGACLCFAAGCSDHHHDGDRQQVRQTHHWTLPPNLQPVAEGPSTLDYKAESDGRVYVIDSSEAANTVVARRHIRAGQVIEVSAAQDQITIDGRSVLNQDLNKTHSYRIYFVKE